MADYKFESKYSRVMPRDETYDYVIIQAICFGEYWTRAGGNRLKIPVPKNPQSTARQKFIDVLTVFLTSYQISAKLTYYDPDKDKTSQIIIDRSIAEELFLQLRT